MIYKFSYGETRLEFSRNHGRAFIAATSATTALAIVRDLFHDTRDESVVDLREGKFQVDFKVALDYRLPLVRSIDKTVRLLTSPDIYRQARYVDRYIIASIARETGKPGWVPAANLKEEISALRKGAVVAREVGNITRFVDWDICIHNYIELNSKEGFRSRVVRKTVVAVNPDDSMVDLS
jgi:hypothetical protein